MLWNSQTSADGQGWADYLNSIENVVGSAFNDTLIGDGSDNVFKGGAGFDQFYGGSGVDTVDYRDATSSVIANLGVSGASVDGQGASDYMNSIENLIGSNFTDILVGDFNANNLSGAGGNDTLTGAGGADSFIFVASGGVDTIVDFNKFESDKLYLQSNLNGSGIFSSAQALAHAFNNVSGNAVVDLGGGNSVTLLGVNAASLAASDFVVF